MPTSLAFARRALALALTYPRRALTGTHPRRALALALAHPRRALPLAFPRPHRALPLALASLAALAALPACVIVTEDDADDHACTLAGCNDGLKIDFAPRSGAWQPGEYSFTIATADRVVRCQATLPLPPCAQAVSRCDAPGVVLLESGCALEPSAQGFDGLFVSDTPGKVDVTIERNREPLARAELFPTYN
ncbi:MAG TPA: hypothetical protein VFS00_26890, partial [Polyangiaceae bacterium]|nr:hypothetical protein [Polyangiaceae bacterium]